MRSKCVHILQPPLVSEEVTEITIPRIQSYARSIGADINLIGSKRKFPEYPLQYERLQIFDDGKDYEWNLAVDGDLLIGENVVDPTLYLSPKKIALTLSYPLSACASVESRIFQRDKRDLLPLQFFLVTSHLTHELWEPLPGPPQHHIGSLIELDRMAEYACAYNIARYGLQVSGTFPRGAQVFKAFVNPAGSRTASQMIQEKLREWGER